MSFYILEGFLEHLIFDICYFYLRPLEFKFFISKFFAFSTLVYEYPLKDVATTSSSLRFLCEKPIENQI